MNSFVSFIFLLWFNAVLLSFPYTESKVLLHYDVNAILGIDKKSKIVYFSYCSSYMKLNGEFWIYNGAACMNKPSHYGKNEYEDLMHRDNYMSSITYLKKGNLHFFVKLDEKWSSLNDKKGNSYTLYVSISDKVSPTEMASGYSFLMHIYIYEEFDQILHKEYLSVISKNIEVF